MWFGKYSRLEKIIIIGYKTGLTLFDVSFFEPSVMGGGGGES